MNIEIKKLEVAKINQFQKEDTLKGVYFGNWSFGDIVNSIKFTHREPLNFDIFKEVTEFKKKYPEFDTDYYQRLINDDRTKKVIQFIIKEIRGFFSQQKETLITFPTSLILSLYLSEVNTLEEYQVELADVNGADVSEENVGVFFENLTVYLPNRNIMLVVDGQHRLAGIYAIYKAIQILLDAGSFKEEQFNRKLIDYAQKSIEKLDLTEDDLSILKQAIENFQFSCTILLDFDIWEQGKVFADVNFNQKPVNKSLYYDIFGSYPDPEKNDIYLAHNWTILLNSIPGSPLYKKIKLLGTGEGFFSQAFFVEALLPLLRKNGIWSKVVADFIVSDTVSQTIPNFLKAYFSALTELYEEYSPKNITKASTYKNVLFKTTGLGALIKLIPFVYKAVEDSLYLNEEILKEKIKSIFTSSLTEEKLLNRLEHYIKSLEIKLQEYQSQQKEKDIIKTSSRIDSLNKEKEILKRKITGEYYFSSEGNFSKSAGKGLQDKLYKELAFDLGFINTK
jgi:hypothetical protein